MPTALASKNPNLSYIRVFRGKLLGNYLNTAKNPNRKTHLRSNFLKLRRFFFKRLLQHSGFFDTWPSEESPDRGPRHCALHVLLESSRAYHLPKHHYEIRGFSRKETRNGFFWQCKRYNKKPRFFGFSGCKWDCGICGNSRALLTSWNKTFQQSSVIKTTNFYKSWVIPMYQWWYCYTFFNNCRNWGSIWVFFYSHCTCDRWSFHSKHVLSWVELHKSGFDWITTIWKLISPLAIWMVMSNIILNEGGSVNGTDKKPRFFGFWFFVTCKWAYCAKCCRNMFRASSALVDILK